MRYVLTEHARDVIARRQIKQAWIEQALLAPDRTEADATDGALEHRLAAIPEFGNRVLRVIVSVQVRPQRVITAYFDRRMRGAE